MSRKNRIQNLLISHLLERGSIAITLPDGMVLELGITQEGKDGSLVKQDNYCWVIASQKDRIASIDSYNLGLRFGDNDNKIIFRDSSVNEDGEKMCVLNIV